VASVNELVERAGLAIESWQGTSELPAIPEDWQRREEELTARLREKHGHAKAWQLTERQGELVARLLEDSIVTGELLTLPRSRRARTSS